MKVNVKRRITGPDAPALGPVLTISDTALTLTLDRPATGPTRIDRYEIERLVGSTWTQIASGLSVFGAGNAYPDTGLLPSTTYQYRCRAVDTTERSSEYSYAFGATSDGAVNQAPVWTSGTIAVSVQAGSSVSISEYCSDPNGDPLSFSKVSVFQPDITISASGVISVGSSQAAGSYTPNFRASDGLLTADKVIDLTVTAASSGATHYIESGVTTYSGSAVQPGDTVIIRAGVRGPLSISNLDGSASQRITLTNESTGAVTISGSSSFLFQFTNCSYVTVDGSSGGQTYGIAVECATSTSGVTSLMKFNGINHDMTLRNFSIDGKRTTFGSAVTPIGFQMHDNTVLQTANPGVFQQDTILCENFYIHRVSGEGMYVGPNFVNGACPMRNIEIRDGLVEDTGAEGIQGKAWFEGANSIHDCIVRRCGRNTVSREFGVSVTSGTADVYNNIIEDSGYTSGDAPGLQLYSNNGPPENTTFNGYGPYSTFPCNVYNNVITGASADGITAGANSANHCKPEPYIYNNTILNNGGYGVTLGSNVDPGFVRNNIALGNSTGAINVGSGGSTEANNLTTGAQSSIFVSPETGDYHLATEQAAVDGTGTDISATDIEGTSRSGTASKGAYEYA